MQNVTSVNNSVKQYPVVQFKATNNPYAGVPANYQQDMFVKQQSKDNWQKAGTIASIGLAAAFITMAITGIVTHKFNVKQFKNIEASAKTAKKNSNAFDISQLKFQNLAKDDSVGDIRTTKTLQEDVKNFYDRMSDIRDIDWNIVKQSHTSEPKFPNAGLLLGPSGTGKTESVKMYAKSQNSELLIIKLGDYANSYVNGTSTNMTKMFDALKELFEKNPDKKYTILFDEADGIAKKLENISGDHNHLNEDRQAFLTGLDTILPCKNITVFAATNAPLAEMDKAVISRFGKNVEFKLPDRNQLLEGLKFHLRHIKDAEKFLNDDANLDFLNTMTEHKYSFRDLTSMVKDADLSYVLDETKQHKVLPLDKKYFEEAIKSKGKTSAETDVDKSVDNNLAVNLLNLLQNLA